MRRVDGCVLKNLISIKHEARVTCFHRSAKHIFLTFSLVFSPIYWTPAVLTVWVGEWRDGERSRRESEVGQNGVFEGQWKDWSFRCHWQYQTGGAAAPAVSWVAGDFISKAALTELFPKEESVTVYVKSRIAQLQIQRRVTLPVC